MIVVSDTSPLLNLARINRLEILPSLYQRVLIPSAVYEELAVSLPEQPAAIRFDSISWITVASAKDAARVQELLGDLDAGVAEAIVLALESHADLLLIDERRGRRTATAAGLKVTGLLGVIVAAKRAGLIDRVKPVLD